MKLKYLFTLLLALTFINVSADSHSKVKAAVEDDIVADSTVQVSLVDNYMDSLAVYQSKLSSIELTGNNDNDAEGPATSRLFVPLTFYHSSVGQLISINGQNQQTDDVGFAINNALLSVYLNRPELVRTTETQLIKAGTIRKDDNEKPKPSKTTFTDKVAPKPIASQPEAPQDILITKPNFWKFSANSKFQLQQYYYSDNWHKGGESNYSMFGELIIRANYNNKQKVKFDNELVMQLGLRNSREDTLHKFKSNTDVLRYTGKLGLQATKKWYYSVELIASTQFMHGLRNNDPKVYSDFMSPFNLNFGVGMDYVVATKNNKLTGSVNISALAFNFKYVDRKDLASRFGIKNGHRTAEDFGSKINANLTWKISDMVSWRTRFYAYTSYKRALLEWENTFKLQVSKYISANLVVYPRFDDSVKRDEDLGYFQFQEYSSLGFEYAF